MRDPIERAYAMLAESGAQGRLPHGIANPFGVPDPEAWRWRISRDVLTEMTRRVEFVTVVDLPPLDGAVPLRLFGIKVGSGDDLPPNAMILERT